jgi:hydroxymethylpyrimidine pyrophosphatase-like HAD family hydrolase
MRSLNLDQLRAFVEVVAHGNFTAAAKELNLSQPCGHADGRIIHSSDIERIHKEVLDFKNIEAVSRL